MPRAYGMDARLFRLTSDAMLASSKILGGREVGCWARGDAMVTSPGKVGRTSGN